MQVGQLSSSEVSQQVQIEVLPPVLFLHLKRFLYDAAADGIVKINKTVKFAPELEIPQGTIFPFVFLVIEKSKNPSRLTVPEIMTPVAGKSVEPANYKLYGVLYHVGESASDGQYTVDVLSGEGWLHFGEEGVSVVRHEDVFEGHDNEQLDDESAAYILIYCRTAPNQI